MDDNGQMLVIESIVFATIVIMSLVFLYQLSSSSTIPIPVNDLKEKGDDALNILYNMPISEQEYQDAQFYPKGYVPNKLVHYFYSNDSAGLVTDLNNLLMPNIMYNVYVRDETQTKAFTSRFNLSGAMNIVGQTARSHCFITIENGLGNASSIFSKDECTYDLILEMWYL